jgi:hypothetical protein
MLLPYLTFVAETYDAGGKPTVCVSGVWVGVDNAWEQEKLKARKNA